MWSVSHYHVLSSRLSLVSRFHSASFIRLFLVHISIEKCSLTHSFVTLHALSDFLVFFDYSSHNALLVVTHFSFFLKTGAIKFTFLQASSVKLFKIQRSSVLLSPHFESHLSLVFTNFEPPPLGFPTHSQLVFQCFIHCFASLLVLLLWRKNGLSWPQN